MILEVISKISGFRDFKPFNVEFFKNSKRTVARGNFRDVKSIFKVLLNLDILGILDKKPEFYS